jgi:uroporphyrinogen decarboxylase
MTVIICEQGETMPLTPRERVLMSINHEEPDRAPIILGTSNTTGMKLKPYKRLKELLGIQSEDRYIYDWPELGTVLAEERILERLHSDARGVLDRFPASVYERNRSRPPHTPFIDDWGGGQIEIEEGVWFPGIHPMPDAKTIDEIEKYPWPDMDDPTRVAHVRAEARKLREQTDYAVIGTPWLLFPFERAHEMQRMDKFMINMGRNPEFAQALLNKIASLCKTLMGHFLDEAGEYLDIIKIGDDLGTKSSLMISPKMYRQFLKPIHADFIQFIKQRTKAKLFFHTDGDVFDLIPDFIEIGVDILNPIQTSAGKMSDLVSLKKLYGDKLTFCGAVDTASVLPFGTPQEVAAEVKRVTEILAPGGGYMLASVHTILEDVPPENILAMVDAV